MFRSILFTLLLLLLITPGQTHDYHTSLTEIRYNPKSKTLEIAVKAFTDDLEKALSVRHKTRIVLDKSERTERMLEAYVRENLVLKTGKGVALNLKYIGRETENDVAWLYLESPELAAPELKRITVQNSLLTEIFNDQMNIVTLEIPGKKNSFLFNQAQTLHQFE